MRAIPRAALLWFLTSPAAAQTAVDSGAPPPPPPSLDRYVIDAAKLVREAGVYSVADLLISQVPGLLVVPGSGLAGAGARIRFAGPRALVADGAPLILVDGIRVDAEEDAVLVSAGAGPSRLDDLSPNDIESIEVLRGPASAAIYGAGGSSGVILIRTKGGTSGPVRWEGYAQGAVGSEPSRWPANYGGVDVDNVEPYARQGRCWLTSQAAGRCVQDFVQTFNPLVERSPFGAAVRRQVGFGASGGPDWGAFRLAGEVDSDDGAFSVPGIGFSDVDRRWNLHASGTVRPFADLQITGGVARAARDVRLPMDRAVQSALIGPSDSTGFAWTPLFANPGTQALDRWSGFLEMRGTPAPDLVFRGLLGLDDVDQLDVTQQGHSWYDGHREVRHTTSSLSMSLRGPNSPSLRFETTLGLERRAYRLDQLQRVWVDTGSFCPVQNPCGVQGVVMRMHTRSAYITEQIAVRDRVFITAALRRDRFKEFGWTAWQPGVAVDWQARSRVRLRAAYGSVGEPPNLPIEAFFIVVPPGTPPPTPLRPDRTRSFELGAEAGLMGGKWNTRVTFYDMRSNVAFAVPLSSSAGSFGPALTYLPGAEISNRGVEATLAGALLDRPALRWDVRLSVWGNRNRLLRLPSAPLLIGTGGGLLAMPVQMLRQGYPTAGYWTNPIQSFADANGNGIIEPNEVSMAGIWAWAGTPYPTQGLALTSRLSVAQRWRLSTTLDYRAGQTLFNEAAWLRCLVGVCRERNDPATPLAAQATALATSNSASGYIEDADYLKVREVAVAFDVPPQAARAVGARAATITLAGRNLITWTGYSGGDPETGSYGILVSGQPRAIQDYGTVPPLRSWTLRVQLAY